MQPLLLRFDITSSENKRPHRKDITVYNPDGTVYDGPLISPSALDTFIACPRKWGYPHLDHIRAPQKPSQVLGENMHDELLEKWLKLGIPPSSPILTDSGVLNVFPMPHTAGMVIEKPFVFRLQDVTFWGFMDLRMGEHVIDLKTTSDLAWAKTEGELETDTQSNVYGVAAGLLSGKPRVKLSWIYVTTKKKPNHKVVSVDMDFIETLRNLSRKVERAQQMVDFKNRGLTAKQLSPNTAACGDYGGCDFIELCDDIRPGTNFFSKIRQTKLHEERFSMGSILDKVRAQAPDKAKVEQLISNAPTITIGAQPPAPAPAPTAPAPAATASLTDKLRTGMGTPITAPTAPAPQPLAAPQETVRAFTAGVDKDPSAWETVASDFGAIFVGKRDDNMWVGSTHDSTVKRVATSREGAFRVIVEALKLQTAPQAPSAPAPSPTPPPAAIVAPAASQPGAEPEKPRRGRPKGSKNTSAPAVVNEDPAFTLLIDILPLVGNGGVRDIEDLIAPIRMQIEAEAGMHYKLIEFSKGPSILAAQIDESFKLSPPEGKFFVLSRMVDKEVMEVLLRYAKHNDGHAYKGILV